ncbi:hypothetical protein E2493_14910 [Sphingomonas parva]|uniref:Uncharacterized protein n=1 Tax=Sphingomonas parva TaxID=2555898 RepID=A0A4Y8ZNG1_9SPHN|nr:hypothetical protein [Sphingomonas parva]TFI57494.1 hypothetical protein E2493_14910 [Sphingomonas parva]
MKSLLLQTKSEKAGTIDGLNLFFGALLGANLGTLGRMPLGDYVELVIFLSAAVVGLRLISTSDRRLLALATLALIGIALVLRLSSGDYAEALSTGDLQRLEATLAIWVAFALLVEAAPTYTPVAPAQPTAPPDAEQPDRQA